MTRRATSGRQRLDALVVGAGVGGLWAIERLTAAGLTVAIVDAGAADAQTPAAQGIIHGGLKYVLDGGVPKRTTLAAMPARWRACLAGDDAVDLRGLPVVAEPVHLFPDGSFGSTVATRIAALAQADGARLVPHVAWPAPFDAWRGEAAAAGAAFDGPLCALDDFVIDVAALQAQLTARHRERFFAFDARTLTFERTASAWQIDGADLALETPELVLCCGSGTGALLEHLGAEPFPVQRRPLHQVWVEAPELPELHAHAVGTGSEPTVTITTHHEPGGPRWYLGGALASDGAGRGTGEQIDAARACLGRLLPWLRFDDARFTTHPIDRVEPAGLTPAGRQRAVVIRRPGLTLAWPMKLSLAPDLGDQLAAALGADAPALRA